MNITGSSNLATINGGGGGGGSKAHFCGESDLSFGHHTPQVPLIEKETFAEVLGPQRLTA